MTIVMVRQRFEDVLSHGSRPSKPHSMRWPTNNAARMKPGPPLFETEALLQFVQTSSVPRPCLMIIAVSAYLDGYTGFSPVSTPTYDEVAPKIEYWIELALTQQLTTVDKLVEYVSDIAWTSHRSPASFARFLQEFRDSPRRSAQARSFVDDLCTRVFRWFIAASAEDLEME
jgi:hypothetical protein